MSDPTDEEMYKRYGKCINKLVQKVGNVTPDEFGKNMHQCCMFGGMNDCPEECLPNGKAVICDEVVGGYLPNLCSNASTYKNVVSGDPGALSCSTFCDIVGINGVPRKYDKNHWCYESFKNYCKQANDASCNPPKYNCVSNKCVQQNGGQYENLSDCQIKCVKQPSPQPVKPSSPSSSSRNKMIKIVFFVLIVLAIVFVMLYLMNKKKSSSSLLFHRMCNYH